VRDRFGEAMVVAGERVEPCQRLGAATPGEVPRGEEEDRRRADVLLVACLRAACFRDRSVAAVVLTQIRSPAAWHAAPWSPISSTSHRTAPASTSRRRAPDPGDGW